MRRTPVDLYRMGNSMSARMTNIREQDLDIYERSGELWVAANSGGISTFSSRGRGKPGGGWMRELISQAS